MFLNYNWNQRNQKSLTGNNHVYINIIKEMVGSDKKVMV